MLELGGSAGREGGRRRVGCEVVFPYLSVPSFSFSPGAYNPKSRASRNMNE